MASIMMVSLLTQVWGIERDLPMPTLDERYFVTPATYIAASGSLNPHWFGHPGSTIIYPLALLFRLREVVFHGAPLFGAAHSVAARFQDDPGSYYLSGRIWVMILGLACLPLIYLIGRRTVGEVAAFVATGIWAIAPLALQYGTVTRTDTAGLLFALLTILWCMRALDRPTIGRFALCGVAAGFAVSSRYFLATLAIMITLTWCLARARSRTPFLALVAAGGATIGTFALTTPFFFLAMSEALRSLSEEATFRIPFQSHGFVDNLTFYVGEAIPETISVLGCIAAIIGIVLLIRRRTASRVLLLVWVPCVVIESCFLGVHWNRWIIPALPIVLLFAAFGAVESARIVAARVREPSMRRRAFVVLAATAVVLIAAGPIASAVEFERVTAHPSTRVQALHFIEDHIPTGSSIAVEIRGPDLTTSAYHAANHVSLPDAGTVADFAKAGYQYFVINSALSYKFRMCGTACPAQDAFYLWLRSHAHKLAEFKPDVPGLGGPHLAIYDISAARDDLPGALARSRGIRQLTLHTTKNNHVESIPGPIPFVHDKLDEFAAAARAQP
ncbi:MAG: glycosyltransferase family 39 protein [Acidimicrobiia bacterium]